MRQSRWKKPRAWGRERQRETLVVGTVWTTAFSLLHFTPGRSSHCWGGGGREEVWRRREGCVLFCSREKDGEIHLKMLLLYVYLVLGSQEAKEKTHTKQVHTHRSSTCTHWQTHIYKRTCSWMYTLLKVHFSKSKSFIHFISNKPKMIPCWLSTHVLVKWFTGTV